jgi:oligosaccharide repeat unit polymerase
VMVHKNTVSFIFYFLALLSLYIYYAEQAEDLRVSTSILFYLLIAIVASGISYGYIWMTKLNNRMVFFNSMVFFWSIAFYVNSYKILGMQIQWPSIEMAYAAYLTPILAFLATIIFSNKRKSKDIKRVNCKGLNVVATLSIIVAVSIAIYEMSVTGIVPILMDNINQSRLEYSLPFIHVVSETFFKLSFYMATYLIVISKYRIKFNSLIAFTSLLYFIITFSRSGLMQLGLFLIFIILIWKGKETLSNIRLTGFLLLLVILFSSLGSIRQEVDFSIQEYTESKVENSAVNWLYGYYFVNFDNLALSMKSDPVDYSGKRSFLFATQIFNTKLSKLQFNEYSYIGKLNLGTGFRSFYLDWGLYLGAFFLGLLLLFYGFILSLIKTDLFVLYKALFLTYIALFPMVNRFSGFIPFFIFITIFLLDFLFRRRH